MLRLRHAFVATFLLLPVDALAQRAGSATASITVIAHVAPVLVFRAIHPMAETPDAAGQLQSDLLAVRANVPHRVVVRVVGSRQVELRGPTGRWVAASASTPMHFTGDLGDATHSIECRGAPDACNLVYELRSTDAQFPVRASASLNRESRAAAVSSISTTS